MAMTNAEKQAAFRQRRDARIREMEKKLRNHDGDGAQEEIAKLKAELKAANGTVKLAMEAIKMLKAHNKRLRNGGGAGELLMKRADRLAIVKALHPDAAPDHAAKVEASQLFNALHIIELPGDD